jgi:hypothetical protein
MAKDSKQKLLDRAKKAFKVACEAESDQREREREDLRFQVAEYQWDEDAKKQRQGTDAIPGRPMLSVPLLTQPLQLIQNQAAQAQLGVEIHPVSEDADEELAEIKQGLYRRIERDSNAQLARLWALARATHCGRGWYRVNTQYDEDADETNDQEIVIERILCQENVYMDPAAQRADCSDARWGMVTAWMPVDTFKEQFPGKQVPASDTEFASWNSTDPQWVMEKDEKAVLVAEFFYKTYEGERVTGVKYCKLTGREVLEQQDWNGKYIPLIPVIGRELQPFEGERRWEGLVRQARDGQKFANYSASSLVEGMATEPKAPFVADPRQIEGFEDMWQQANTRNFPVLFANMISTPDGHPVPPPARVQIDGSRMTLSLQAFQQARDMVQTATAVFAPSLGETPAEPTAQSGRAVLALQQQSDAGTSHFLQNLAKISMAYEARVILDLMPKIYDRPGRITQVLGDEDDPKMVMLNHPFVPGEDGRPRPVQPVPGLMPPEGIKDYDLTRGQYAISVSVGKSYQTRLQEGQAEIGEVLAQRPELMPMIGDVYFRFRDFPGAKEIADRLKKIREKQFPGLGDDEEGGMTLEQAEAQLQQMQQQLQELGQAHEQAIRKIETDQAKQEATIAKTQMETDSREAIAKFSKQMDLLMKKLELQGKMAEGDAEREHEAIEGELDREHEDRTEEFGAARDVTLEAMKERGQERIADKAALAQRDSSKSDNAGRS